MPRYEYRCRSCGETFEVNRPMREASAPASCPHGHDDTVKLLSTISLTGSVGGSAAGRGQPGTTGERSAGGGCCGGGCGC